MVAEIQNLVSWELTCPSYPLIYGSGDLPDSEGEDEIVECSVCLQSKKKRTFSLEVSSQKNETILRTVRLEVTIWSLKSPLKSHIDVFY